jgi:hypothetical protein
MHTAFPYRLAIRALSVVTLALCGLALVAPALADEGHHRGHGHGHHHRGHGREGYYSGSGVFIASPPAVVYAPPPAYYYPPPAALNVVVPLRFGH